jgi:hypothetical protein
MLFDFSLTDAQMNNFTNELTLRPKIDYKIYLKLKANTLSAITPTYSLI